MDCDLLYDTRFNFDDMQESGTMSQLATETPVIDLNDVNDRLKEADASEVVAWAAKTFGDSLVMTSSFGAQSAVMLHLVTQVAPGVPVIFIDTGFLFAETYRFADELTRRLNLNLKVYNPAISAARLEALHGAMWDEGVEGLTEYHKITKVEPMQRALEQLNVKAWLAGLRAEQTNLRANLRRVDVQNGRYKVHPILRWTTRDVHEYLKKHDLPYHPLYHQGYASIGDTHSTVPITEGMSEREGRFGGLKQECGLHLPVSEEENASRGASDL